MAIDRNTIPEQVIEDLLEGLERESGSLTDILCERVPVDEISGTIPVEPSIASLPRETKHGLIAEGAEARAYDDEMDEVAYSCKRAVGMATIPDGTAAQADSVTGTSTVQRLLRKVMQRAHRDMDAYLETKLGTTGNTEADVTAGSYGGAAWSNASSSTPLADIDLALDDAPGSDTLFIGRDDEKSLKVHPDVVAEISNFSAGFASGGQLASLMTSKFGFQNVAIGNQFFSNAANEGQPLDLAFDLAGITWLGYKRDLILCEYGAPNTEQGRVLAREADQLLYSRRIDILRPHSEMGVTFTNT